MSKRTFTPPAAVAKEAQEALDLRASLPPSKRCCTPVGIRRASQLANRQPVSIKTLKRMKSYFDRHEVDKKGKGWGVDSKGWQAWLAWGGDSGRKWAEKILKEVNNDAKRPNPFLRPEDFADGREEGEHHSARHSHRGDGLRSRNGTDDDYSRKNPGQKEVISFDFDQTLQWYKPPGTNLDKAGPNESMLKMMLHHMNRGQEIIIVTARYQSKESEREISEFIRKYNLPVKRVYFTNQELKARTLDELGVSRHYDDSEEELEALPSHIEGKLAPLHPDWYREENELEENPARPGDDAAVGYVRELAETLETERGLDPSQAMGLAWSIACKYKRDEIPELDDHCTKEPEEYLMTKRFNPIRVKGGEPTEQYARIVAEAYEAAPSFDPTAIPAFQALIQSVEKIFKQIQSKVRVEFVAGQPYRDDQDLINKVRATQVLKVSTDFNEHPVFTPEQNLKFRAVHDWFAHIITGSEFSQRGEIKAYNAQAKLTPKRALPALFTEVLGQACYATVYGEFPEQKIAILPGFDYLNIGEGPAVEAGKARGVEGTKPLDPTEGYVYENPHNQDDDKCLSPTVRSMVEFYRAHPEVWESIARKHYKDMATGGFGQHDYVYDNLRGRNVYTGNVRDNNYPRWKDDMFQRVIDIMDNGAPLSSKKNPADDDNFIQRATEEMEEDGTEGSFTAQARRAGYSDTLEFAEAVMAGWRSGSKKVLNKKTGRKQGITLKTMRRANFALNAQKRRNPHPQDSFEAVEEILIEEGGAAGLKALKPAFSKPSQAKARLAKMPGIMQHETGDYALREGWDKPRRNPAHNYLVKDRKGVDVALTTTMAEAESVKPKGGSIHAL